MAAMKVAAMKVAGMKVAEMKVAARTTTTMARMVVKMARLEVAAITQAVVVEAEASTQVAHLEEEVKIRVLAAIPPRQTLPVHLELLVVAVEARLGEGADRLEEEASTAAVVVKAAHLEEVAKTPDPAALSLLQALPLHLKPPATEATVAHLEAVAAHPEAVAAHLEAVAAHPEAAANTAAAAVKAAANTQPVAVKVAHLEEAAKPHLPAGLPHHLALLKFPMTEVNVVHLEEVAVPHRAQTVHRRLKVLELVAQARPQSPVVLSLFLLLCRRQLVGRDMDLDTDGRCGTGMGTIYRHLLLYKTYRSVASNIYKHGIF